MTQKTSFIPNATQVLYGYVDETGYAYPLPAGQDLDEYAKKALTPIYDADEWQQVLKNLERKNPAVLTGAATPEQVTEQIEEEEHERLQPKNRNAGKAAEKAISATNVEGQTAPAPKRKPYSTPIAPLPTGADAPAYDAGEDD